MKNNSTELFPIIDEQGHTIGKATRKECHNGSKLLHPVIHLQIFNKYGNLYLQKRAMNKDIQPGKWDTAVGGHDRRHQPAGAGTGHYGLLSDFFVFIYL